MCWEVLHGIVHIEESKVWQYPSTNNTGKGLPFQADSRCVYGSHAWLPGPNLLYLNSTPHFVPYLRLVHVPFPPPLILPLLAFPFTN